MPTATLTSKGQLTIPVEVREALGLKTGDKIDFFLTADGSYALQPKTGSIMEMYGILAKYAHKGRKAPAIDEMNEAIVKAASEDYLRSMRDTPVRREKAS